MKYLSNKELVETWRALADFYETHPLVPVPVDMCYGWMRTYCSGDDVKEVLRSVGSFTKKFEDDRMLAQVPVGHITLDILVNRDAVCERKVVGKRIVPAQTIPSSYTEEKVIPEHEEDIVEWDCHSVLAPDSPPEQENEPVQVPDIPF